MHLNRKLAAVVAGAALALVAPAAYADIVHNDLDNTIDAELEVLNLSYDPVAMTGTSGSTTLAIQVEGQPDHPGCNIQGGSHFITLAPVLSTADVATVSLSNGGTIQACVGDNSTVIATVEAIGVGSTNVTFEIVDRKTAGDGNLDFSLAEAAFTVNVTEGAGEPPVGCDADPAAPAWAAAMLQKSGIKAKAASNYISQIAHGMGNGATFGGFAKNAHPAYENAVHDELEAIVGKTIASPQSSARPGWVCTAQ